MQTPSRVIVAYGAALGATGHELFSYARNKRSLPLSGAGLPREEPAEAQVCARALTYHAAIDPTRRALFDPA
jgi:hypothetical protein